MPICSLLCITPDETCSALCIALCNVPPFLGTPSTPALTYSHWFIGGYRTPTQRPDTSECKDASFPAAAHLKDSQICRGMDGPTACSTTQAGCTTQPFCADPAIQPEY